MRILLDTNILIFGLLDEGLIGKSLPKLIHNSEAAHFSILSLWEIALLQAKDKISLTDGIETVEERLCHDLLLSKIGLETNDLMHLEKLPIHKNHKDPFDRMIIATALTHNLQVVTTDRSFELYDIDVELIKV